MRIEELSDRYRFHNVSYRGESHIVDWSKTLLNDGAKHKQEEWIELTKDKEWTLADAPLYFATFKGLCALRDTDDKSQQNLVSILKKMFRDDFVSGWTMTSSHLKMKCWRVLGGPKQDESHMLHRWGYDDEKKEYFTAHTPHHYDYIEPLNFSKRQLQRVSDDFGESTIA